MKDPLIRSAILPDIPLVVCDLISHAACHLYDSSLNFYFYKVLLVENNNCYISCKILFFKKTLFRTIVIKLLLMFL